jgi:hypothetical protein
MAVTLTEAGSGSDEGSIGAGQSDPAQAQRELDQGRFARWRWPDLVIVAILATCTVVAHPVSAVLARPYWLDEAWVAVLTRVPWSQMPSLSSSTPIGWLALLRLVPGGGLQRGRALVLGFSVAGVVAVYALVRSIDWPSTRVARVAAAATALVVCWVPLSLMRNDLKQYTADAFFAVVLLATGRTVERRPNPWSVAWLGAVAVLALPFSSVSAFVSIAVFAAVLGSASITRDRTRALATLAVGAAVACVFAVYFAVILIPNDTPALRQWWAIWYLNGSRRQLVHETWDRLEHLRFALAMPPIVVVASFVLAIVVLARRREYSLALALPVLWIELFLLGVAHRYPFLDLRTSHFALVPTIAVIAFGVVDCLVALWHRHAAAALVTALVLTALFGSAVHRSWRDANIVDENTRTATRYVAQNLRPGDVVVVDWASNWGFSYYWPRNAVQTHRNKELSMGFTTTVRGLDNAVYVSDRLPDHVSAALQTALDRQRLTGLPGRLFIVRSHMTQFDRRVWKENFSAFGLWAQKVTTDKDPLLEIDFPPRHT